MNNHSLLLLVLSLIAPLLSNQTNRYNGPKIEADFPIIGPFIEGDDDYQLKGVVTPHEDFDMLREIVYFNYRDGSPYSAFMTPWHGVVKDVQYDLTFILPLHDALYGGGINVRILFMDYDKNVHQEYMFNLSPIRHETIDPKDYMNDYYELHDIIIDPDYYPHSFSERFMFLNFPDYINGAVFCGIIGFLATALLSDGSVNTMPMFYTMLGLGLAINAKDKWVKAEEPVKEGPAQMPEL